MFTIEKDLSGIFWHIYNNARTRVNVSDFDVVIDSVSQTFIVQCKNGSNIPSQAISISLIQVIDLSVGTSPIAFSGADGLIQLLTAKNYTPYLQPTSDPVVIYRVGQVGVFTMTPTQFTNNFTETGLGINTMLGWALRNESNGTKNQQGKFSLNKGAAPYDVIGAIGGSPNAVLVGHDHLYAAGDPRVPVMTGGSGGLNIGRNDPSGFLIGAGDDNKVALTGISENGAVVPSQTAEGKNMPPYLIDVWVERVTELVINAGGGGGGGVQTVTGVNVTGTPTDRIVGVPTLQQVTDDGNNETTSDIIVKDSESKISLQPRNIRFDDIDEGGNTSLRFINTDAVDQEIEIRGLGGTMALTSDIPTLVAGTNITIDDADPLNPIISASGGGIPTLQEVLDNNHDLVDGNFFAGTGAGDTNTGTSVIGIGESAASGNSGIHINAFGEVAGLGNSGSEVNALGPLAGEFNTGNSVNAFGNGTGLGNSGNNVNAFGSGAGGYNTFNNVNLFGENATADENGQTVLSKDGTIMARISTTDLTESRKYTLQDADGTLAFLSDITGGGVTQTSQLTNDGSDGVNPFITALDIPTTGQASTLVREVKNMTGATLTKGTVVYISGANGNKALVSKAIASTDALSARTFGLLQSNISNNGLGNCVIIGDLSGIDTSSFAEGAQLYLSGVTAGAFTDTRVLAPTHLVYVGKVTRSHPTQGQIEVGIQNGYELAEIHDVSITSVTNNQLLAYTSATDIWENKNLIDILERFNRTQGIYFFEEFMGSQGGGITTNFGGLISSQSGILASCATTATITNRTNQQGVVRSQTGTTATGSAGYTYGNLSLFRGTGAITLETYVTVETLSNATERFYNYFGYLGIGSSVNPNNGIFFIYDEAGSLAFGANAGSPNWKCVTINTLTRTFTTTSIPVVAGQWYKLRININDTSNSIEFYIDNILVATHTTNIPSVATGMSIGSYIIKTVGTTARGTQTDYFMYEEIFTNLR